MQLQDFSLLFLSLPMSYAQNINVPGNLTIAFYPTSGEAACEANDFSQALTLTTSTVPSAFVCWDIAELFTSSSDNGVGNEGNGHTPLPRGSTSVNYTLTNRGSYNPEVNYTNVWFQQTDLGTKPGDHGKFVFYMYAFENCTQVGGDDYNSKEWPWFETSCETKTEGECRQVPKSIKSFAINNGPDYNHRHGQCETWAVFGTGVSMWNRQTMVLMAGAATFAAFLVL